MTESAIVSTAITDWVDAGNATPSPIDRLAEITIEALRNAKINPADLDAVIANTAALPFDESSYITISAQHFAHRLLEKIGSHGIQCINVCAACASGAIALATLML